MLIAIMTILFLGGSGVFGPIAFVDEAIDNARIAISDDDHRKATVAELKAINKRSKEYMKTVKGLGKDLNSYFSEHEVANEEIEAAWTSIFELNDEYSRDIIEMRFELRDQLSREEWQALFPAEGNSES